MSDWRPRTGWEIQVSDRTLAKIGFLAACDEQARQISLACLKSVKRMSGEEWRAAQRLKFFQITKQLLDDSSSLDAELHGRVRKLEEKRIDAQGLRHRFVHSLWGHNTDENQQTTYDFKASTLSKQSDLREALDGVAHLTLIARRCLERVADLICDGTLPEGAKDEAGPKYKIEGRWISF